MKVISLGWGVQSFALATMSALGVLPSVDAAIHADTGHERRETLEIIGAHLVTACGYASNAQGAY